MNHCSRLVVQINVVCCHEYRVKLRVSAAYLQKPIPRDPMTRPISVTIAVNRMGPSTRPCEAHIIIVARERQLFRRVCFRGESQEVK